MIRLSNNPLEDLELRSMLKADSIHKKLRVTIGGSIVVDNEHIHQEEFSLKESIMGSKVELRGCMASEMKLKVQCTQDFTKKNWKGTKIKVEMCLVKQWYNEETEEFVSEDTSYFPMFTGFIDECKKDRDKEWQQLTCYDALYTLGSTKIYTWYKGVFSKYKKGKIDLRHFRDELFSYMGIEQEEIVLPQDDVVLTRKLKDKDMTFLDWVQDLCQLNCCFGLISRDGKFKYHYIVTSASDEVYDIGAYPNLFYPDMLAPNQTTYNYGSMGVETVPYYRSITYEDFVCKPLADGITIRQSEKDSGVTVFYVVMPLNPSDWEDTDNDTYIDQDDDDVRTGSYIIERNLFAYKFSKKKRAGLMSNIYARITNLERIAFRNYKAVCNGLPHVECGDIVNFTKRDGSLISFVITTRELKGIQAMTDTYSLSIKSMEEASKDGKSIISVGHAKTSTSVSQEDMESYVGNQLQSYDTSSVVDQKIANATQTGVLYIQRWDATTKTLYTTATPPNGGVVNG